MTDQRDGGPAYPVVFRTMTPQGMMEMDAAPGMTLRDWFAGQALANVYTAHEANHEKVVEWAYQIADAMLAARKARHDPA